MKFSFAFFRVVVFVKEKLKVLICDDSMLIRKKLKDSVLSCCGFARVALAVDGLDAIYQYNLLRPDIVFMDIILPGQSGIDTVAELKQIDPTARIVMVSSVGTKANLMNAMKVGACNFIQKPWEQETIDRIIIQFLTEEEKF